MFFFMCIHDKLPIYRELTFCKQMLLTEIQTKKLKLVFFCFEQFNNFTMIPMQEVWGQNDGEYNAP